MSGSTTSLQQFDSNRSRDPARWLGKFGLPVELAGEATAIQARARTIGDDVVIDLDWCDATLIVERPADAMVIHIIEAAEQTLIWRDERPFEARRGQVMFLAPGTTWSVHGDARLRFATINDATIFGALLSNSAGSAPIDLSPVASLISGMMRFLVDPAEDDELLVPADCHKIIVGLTRLLLDNDRGRWPVAGARNGCRPANSRPWAGESIARRTRCRSH